MKLEFCTTYCNDENALLKAYLWDNGRLVASLVLMEEPAIIVEALKGLKMRDCERFVRALYSAEIEVVDATTDRHSCPSYIPAE